MPVVFQPLFLNCWPMDRDAVLTVKKAGARVFSSDMVWSVPDTNSAELQFNSILGETIFQITRQLPNWQVSGPQNLQISENIRGVLTINGFEIPILAEEVGCILAGTWPSLWLRQLTLRESSGRVLTMQGADDQRDFLITMRVLEQPNTNRPDDIQSCAVLRWGGFLGFMRKKITFCREQTKDGLMVSLAGVNDYLIEWVIQNES